MLAEVLLASLVLLVFYLIAVDVVKAESKTLHEQAVKTAVGHKVDGRTDANGTATLLRKIFRLVPENLGVRPCLFLLVSIPTVTAVALGGLRIASSVRSAEAISPGSPLRDRAITSVFVDSAVVLIVLVLALVSTVMIGSSLLRRLRKLRAGALQVADVRLPEAVHRISETGGGGVSLDVEPVDVDSPDEIGEIARAFDKVHGEALRLAANEARLRGNINGMFVNLSRRSQALVERLIQRIDDLEQGEQDSERLGNLFHMDHLATRMRRNSENLLVLAGYDLSKKTNEPVALVDVLRAAVSEIEEYERVSLTAEPRIAVRGAAVNDVVHLLAELAENATSLSPPDTTVTIAGRLLPHGGVLLNISDQGVGMSDEEMARVNQQLENTPLVDVAASRRMGLFVVGRLAARHGIRVQLRPTARGGGLTALVLLPDEVVTLESPAGWLGSYGFGTAEPEAAMSEADSAAFPRTGPGYRTGWVGPDRATVQHEVSIAGTGEVAPAVRDAEPPLPGPWRAHEAGIWPGAERAATSQTAVSQPGMAPQAGARKPSVPGAWPAANHKQTAAGGGSAVYSSDTGAARDGVIVPSVEKPTGENHLPVFEEVRSEWFRRGRGTSEASSGVGYSAPAWVAQVDEGWQAAEKVPTPSSAGLTPNGLPKRVPGANLVPGAAGSTPPPASVRSAAAAQERLASFQRGVREGRAASGGADPDGDDKTV
jgi:signal transduction histidine kinase